VSLVRAVQTAGISLTVATIAAALFVAPLARAEDAPDAEPPPPPRPVAVDVWEARDLEGRWALFSSSKGAQEEWLRFLVARREWDLLEWIAITSRTSDALDALAEANAPTWMRCAVWRLRMIDSHGQDSARTLLAQHARAFLAWLARFPKAETGATATVAKAMRAKPPADEPDEPRAPDGPRAPPEDASTLLPPLDPAEVLRALVPPERVEDLGEAPRSKPGFVYVHQVERAIDALLTTDLRVEPWLSRMSALLRHGHPALRRKAALGYARVPADLVPVDALLALEGDSREPADVRSAALIGASYSSHPKAYVRLCDVANDTTHVAWSAAVSRLGDHADEFTASHLSAVLDRVADPVRKAFFDKEPILVERRLANENPSRLPERVPRLIARAAWADLVGDPLRETIVPFVQQLLEKHAADVGVREALVRLIAAAGPSLPPATRDPTLADRVRALAQEALDAAKPPK
jgi:hypothetical protein